MIELPPINLGEIDGSTARLMRSYGLSCARAAMERAAQIAASFAKPDGVTDCEPAVNIAAAIRAEMSKEEGK